MLRDVVTILCQMASTFREQKKCREDIETKGLSNGLNIGSQQM